MNDLPYQDNLIMTKDKFNYCKLLQVDYFVDDFISYVEEMSKITNYILFAQPWNRAGQDKFTTVRNLEELYELIKGNTGV